MDIFERSLSSPPPSHSGLVAIITSQLRSRLDEHAKDDSPIIISQLDQAGFGDESAKLDELTRSLAALHLPFSRVGAGASGFNAVPCCYCPLERRQRYCQLLREHL